MLISYHAHSFRVRRTEIFDIELPLPVIAELNNARRRLRNDFTDTEKIGQAIGFHEVISRSRNIVTELAEQAKENEDSREQYKEAKDVMEIMSAADYLLELLDA
jgi:hypothetical protein